MRYRKRTHDRYISAFLRIRTATTPVSRDGPNVMALERGQQQQQQQQKAEQRRSGLLEEGELFYVDLSSDDVDGFDRPHGYENLGGMCYHVAMRLAIAESESSGGDTETISKTDSDYTDDSDRVQRGTDECPGMSTLLSLPLPHIKPNSPVVSSRAKVRGEGAVDPCVAMLRDLRRVWGWLTGSASHKEREDYSVEYLCQNWNSSISFKYFGKFNSDVDVLRQLGVVPGTYTSQIPRFRVVSTMWERYAEYEVCIMGGGRRWVSWERFSNFKHMAAFCARVDLCGIAWARVMMAQLHYRCLDQKYLTMKCRLLEMFLERVMFAMPTPTLLIQFLTHK